MSSKTAPIIVIKKKSGHGGHHGGAWKVAYADFVTAMMSLFIVLWLMNSSEKIKKAVAGYFNDPKGTASLMGTTMTGTGETMSAAAAKDMEKLKEKLEEQIKAKKNLEKLSKQIEITLTPEGLRVELLEDKNGTFYQSGSALLSDSGQELLALLAGELKTLPNSLLIEGHTDAAPYLEDAAYSNWELSADRANAARRLMQQDGVRTDQVTQVRGYADQLLRVKANPYDPSNRRISILVKNQQGVSAAVKEAATSNDQPEANLGSAHTEETNAEANRADTSSGHDTDSHKDVGQTPPPTQGGWMARVKRMIPRFGK
ncbi:MAG: OmpA family protein [Acidobacteria bacterium]|nr:OmpA family protein [Acidobacteriota bacterium]